MTFSFLSCYAQITQVTKMDEVFHYLCDADPKTWAIFDVDMVLIQPSDPAFQMANMKRFSSIAKRMMKEIPSEKQMVFLGLMTTDSSPVLIDERLPRFLQEIQQKGIPTMALTANLTGEFGSINNMEKWRLDSLCRLGIDFAKNAPCQKMIVFDDLVSYRGNYSTYLNGVLFVNGTAVSKGEALLSFLNHVDSYPEKIVFIDDREDNLKSVEAALEKLSKKIEYTGIHFMGAQYYPSKLISEEEFEQRWEEKASEANNLK